MAFNLSATAAPVEKHTPVKVVFEAEGIKVTTGGSIPKLDEISTRSSNSTYTTNDTWKTYNSSTKDTRYTGGTMTIVGYDHLKVKHYMLAGNDDVLSAYGDSTAYWSGTSPANASNITNYPEQTVDSSTLIYSVGLPGGVSVTNSSTSATCKWVPSSVNNESMQDYYWANSTSPLTLKTAGHFTSINMASNVKFTFGAAAYSFANNNYVSISL